MEERGSDIASAAFERVSVDIKNGIVVKFNDGI